VSIREAKTHLSRLVDRAAAGEEIVIAKSGKPVAKLVPYIEVQQRAPRRLGVHEGLFTVPEDFDDPLPPEIQAYFDSEIDDFTDLPNNVPVIRC
jgi:prevent-host-death family protein